MTDYISLSVLNDFVFCPYSIYLHNVYAESDDDLYKASPQVKGTIAHQGVDCKSGSTKSSDIMSIAVYCDELGISGKIDVFKQDRHLLIERKRNISRIYRGQIYQLWGQYFCMKEMGYKVDKLAFYEISTNRMINVALPNELGKQELVGFIRAFKSYDPMTSPLTINQNKCLHCIYCNICDKTESDNVYT